MKIIYKQPSDPSQKKKVVDIHKYSIQRNKYFKFSVFMNIILFGTILLLLSIMRGL